jgi:Glu-tRNA(Gln) amidotransferase subunit E-like FAD-binding protein
MNYKKLGLRVGLEIHHELDTKNKLFCSCPPLLKTKGEPDLILERYQRPVAGETGEIDVAAIEEMKKGVKIIYEVYNDCDCLIDIDEEPPHEPNEEAIKIALTIAALFNCEIVDEIHVMRKTIIDGSLPSGFQRTMLIGTKGWIETSQGKVEIEAVSLEEDSGRLIKKDKNSVTFRLDRLGVPEVEIGTGKGIVSLEHAKEVAQKIGNIVRSTGRAKIREGSVRQDINISIKGGDRVEVKHVPSLSLIPVVIEKEIKRQLSLIKNREKISRDVRKVLEDGSTDFLRPLPGAARMYPETDVIPVKTSELLRGVKKLLPETWDQKIKRYKKSGLSSELAKQTVKSDYVGLFETILKKTKTNPNIIANVFVNTLKDLKKRERIDIENLKNEDFEELFELLDRGRIVKESVPDILSYKAKNPDIKMNKIIKKLSLETMTKGELLKIVKEVIEKNKGQPVNRIIGIVMSKVRGKAKSEDVVEIVKKEIGKIY